MIQSNKCIIHANCPLPPPIFPIAFSELLLRKWKKKIDNPLYFQEIIFAWLVLVAAFQSTEESLLWNYFCLICVGVVAFQSIEESLHEIFCSFSNIWDHFIMKAEKLILVVGCHITIMPKGIRFPTPTSNQICWLTKHLPTHG